MRFKGRMQLEHGLKQIDLVPLINIVFLLLLFLLFSSGFITQSGIRVDLPKSVSSEAVKKENIEIIITSDNSVYLNGKVTNLEELNSYFKSAGKRSQTVLIKADQRASFAKLVEIWDLGRSLGISQINIATNQR